MVGSDDHNPVFGGFAVLVCDMRAAVPDFCLSPDFTISVDPGIKQVLQHADQVAVANGLPLVPMIAS